MAKPLNPYQGPAPASMAQMGQGMAEVGANIGRTLQRGYESMGQGIAGGIKAVGDAYQQYKDDEAKFNATKKMYKLFGDSLDENTKKEFDSFFADTSISTREKNFASPAIMQFLGAAQQQKGREKVADIMNQGRVDAAGARRPTPMSGSTFGGVPTIDSIFNLPANPSQGNPAPLQEQSSAQPGTQLGQPASRIGANGQMEVWSSRLNRYVELDNPMQDIQY